VQGTGSLTLSVAVFAKSPWKAIEHGAKHNAVGASPQARPLPEPLTPSERQRHAGRLAIGPRVTLIAGPRQRSFRASGRSMARVAIAALADVGDSTSHITPDSARRVLASFIIDRALAGERDPRTLKLEALRLLGITHS
jgi:hypothetical protein